jgi:pimeloyl-ACP methyl ester carboxylesterase
MVCEIVIAVMDVLGYSKTSIFASSGRGIIALQLAVLYPSVLAHLVIHGTPTSSLLPAGESTAFMDTCFELQDIYLRVGVKAAMGEFHRRVMVGMDDGVPRFVVPLS